MNPRKLTRLLKQWFPAEPPKRAIFIVRKSTYASVQQEGNSVYGYYEEGKLVFRMNWITGEELVPARRAA
jgi:hypothetical protein